jgi:hypothetical protein
MIASPTVGPADPVRDAAMMPPKAAAPPAMAYSAMIVQEKTGDQFLLRPS